MAQGLVSFQGKQQLLERCREVEFVDNVQDLKCTRCNRLALEHWYTNCGHALCSNCKRLLSGGGFKCPQCDQLIQHIEEQSVDFEEKVNGLHAKCPNSRYGCPLVTTIKHMQNHLVSCEWTKEQVLPAMYRGANTMQMLLEEVSNLKEQMFELKGTNEFLLNELHKRQEVEEEIKRSVEMSVEDIKSQLNGLSSDLYHETTSLKVQLNDFDQIKMKELLENSLEKLKDHFVSKEELKQLQEAVTEINGNNKLFFEMFDQKEDRFSQKLTKEVATLDTKISASEEKINIMQQEIHSELDRAKDSMDELNNRVKHLSTQFHDTVQMSHEIKNKTKILKGEIDQLNKKASEIERNIVGISYTLHADYKMEVQTEEQLNSKLKPIEAFQRGVAIGQQINTVSSIQQLIDGFLFGSAQEQVAFESFCHLWTIEHFDKLIVKKENYESIIKECPVHTYNLQAELSLNIWTNENIDFYLRFQDEERAGQEVDIRPQPMVTFIVKDLNGRNKHCIRYCFRFLNQQLKYNQYGYLSDSIHFSQCHELMLPSDKSLEVLVLVEPPVIRNALFSTNGTIMDTIQHCRRKVQMAKDGLVHSHWSPPFLTHAGGYRVAVKMNFDEPFSKGLVAGIHFLSGEFDSQLEREFNYKTNFTLINQLDASKNETVKRRTLMRIPNLFQIGSEEDLTSDGFIVNDSLKYHVAIKLIIVK